MENTTSVEEDAISTKLILQLSKTPYACSKLLPPFSSKPGNFVYRGILTHPILHKDGSQALSIIIKHFTDPTLRILEELLLRSLENSLSSSMSTTDTTVVVRAPRLYFYDHDTNTLILEDLIDAIGLFPLLVTPDVARLLPSSSGAAVGYALGGWIKSFHVWASAPEQAGLRVEMWRNGSMRKAKYDFTYNTVLNVLGGFPELLDGHEKILNTILDFMSEELKTQATEEGNDEYGLVHGDLWCGNILMNTPDSQHPKNSTLLFIIDWEFTQFNHRSCDLGQLLGDLYERVIYRDLDLALSIIKGVIDGYGKVSYKMAFRIAVYVGMHLISWYERRPRKGPRVLGKELVSSGLRTGRDFMVKGWERDFGFFEGSVLAALFGDK